MSMLAVSIPYWGQSILRILGGAAAVLLPALAIVLTRRRVELPTFGGRGPLPGVDLHDSASLLDAMESAGAPRP